MCKSLHHPKQQFAHLLNGDANDGYPKALLQGLHEIMPGGAQSALALKTAVASTGLPVC